MRVYTGGALAVGGGTFTYSNQTAMTQTFASLTVDAGASTINNTVSEHARLGRHHAQHRRYGRFCRDRRGHYDYRCEHQRHPRPVGLRGTGAGTLYAYSNSGTIAGYTGATVESGSTVFGGIPSGDTRTINYNVTSSGTYAVMGNRRNVNTIVYSGSGATQPAANNTIFDNQWHHECRHRDFDHRRRFTPNLRDHRLKPWNWWSQR